MARRKWRPLVTGYEEDTPAQRAQWKARDLYIVEKVVSHSMDKKNIRVLFRIRWQGYRAVDDTFQYYGPDLEGCEPIEKYIDRHHLRGVLY